MFRTLFSIAAVALLFGMQPTPAAAQTTQAAQSAQNAKGGGRSAAKAAFTGTVNINSASASALEALPGIGAKTAALIVEYREKNGPFKKVEELMNVRGVGEKSFLKLKPQITVATQKADHPSSQP